MKRTNTGFTVLEILLGVMLFALLGASFFTIHQRKRVAAVIRDCKQKQWQWLPMAEEIEWKLNQWKLYGSGCLRAGFQPVSVDPSTGDVTVWKIDSARPTVEDMTIPNFFPVSPGSEFSQNQTVVICTLEKYFRGKVRQVLLKGTKNILDIENEQVDAPAELFTQGTLLLSAKPYVYQAVALEGSGNKLLYEKRSASDQRPLGSGFEFFKVNVANTDEALHESKISITFKAAECVQERTTTIQTADLLTNRGRWWLRGENLVFEPWYTAQSDTPL